MTYEVTFKSSDGSTIHLHTGGGFQPIEQEIIQDTNIKKLAIWGDRFWSSPHEDGSWTHVGSNGWPPNLEELSLDDACNLSVQHLCVPTLQELTLPLIEKLFGSWVERLHVKAKYGEWDWELEDVISFGPREDDTIGETLLFMPQLRTVYLRDGTCCSENVFLRKCDEWLDSRFAFDDSEKWNGVKNMLQWLERHSFWQNYRDRGYSISVTELIKDEGCTIKLSPPSMSCTIQ